MIHYDRVWAEIDLDAIIKNMELSLIHIWKRWTSIP